MASNSSSLDGNDSNGLLSRSYAGSNHDYEGLKQQCDKAMNELKHLRRQHSETARRCDHAMKELDYYRGQHRAAMNQLEASAQDSATLRTKYADVIAEKQRLEREVQALRTELSELQTDVLAAENGNPDSLYLSLSRRNDSIRDDYETSRKRYDDLLSSHSSAIAKLELSQEEASRYKKECEELTKELNNAIRERNGLKQQCTAAIRQWDIAQREKNEYREALSKVQQQHEEAVKEVNQAMAVRMKASKDLKRLTVERNAAMQEYTLIMSERDTVHKEMEKLSDDLAQEYNKNKAVEAKNKELLEEKQALNYQMETLRREIASALQDRDKALKECNDLREKFGEYNAAKEDSRDLIKSRLEYVSGPSESLTRKEASGSGDSRLTQRQRLDNLDQANQELETLRKSLDKAQTELTEAIQEAEVSKRRRDWAFSERDKIVLEQNSIRIMCDEMRKERDRAISNLAVTMRDMDDLKKQRNEALKELKELKEALELEKESKSQQQQQFATDSGGGSSSNNNSSGSSSHNHSHDSAIDSDMQEWETEILDIDLSGLTSDGDLGFELVGGRDDPHYPNDSGIYVAAVVKGSLADGKLRVNDCISRVNNVDCTSVSKRMVLETVRASLPRAYMVVRRRREHSRCLYTTQLAPKNHGLLLETGVYICKISPGSQAAKEGNLAVGDRVLNINNKAMDGVKSAYEAMSILNDDRSDIITVTTLKALAGGRSSTPSNDDNLYALLHHVKKVNSSTQTGSADPYYDDFAYLYGYKEAAGKAAVKATSSQQEKAGPFGRIRETIDMVRGRRHNKSRADDKKKHPNSSSSMSNCEPEQVVIAELDSVLDSYHGNSSGSSSGVLKKAKEKNGGTWPKARSNVLHTASGTGTIVARKRERPPLSIFLTDSHAHCCESANRNSTPLPLPMAAGGHLNRHSVYASKMESSGHFAAPKAAFEPFERLRDKKLTSLDRDRLTNRLSLNPSYHQQRDLDLSSLLRFKNGSDSESTIAPAESHSRVHSQLYVQRLAPYPFPFHAHQSPSPLQLPASEFCFEPPYSSANYHSHSPSTADVAYHKQSKLGAHTHHAPSAGHAYHADIGGYFESGTFPRKKENRRFRIPSNPSVTSKNSGSIERTSSDRGSPMPTFHVEVLSPGSGASKRNSLPDYCWPQKPSPGELRRVHIDKSAEPLGIQISCPDSGGIFVSTVNEHSLASQVGLQRGDQLLEVCGINFRNATYELAANVLRQCGNSITMLVQYSPDKYHELGGSRSSTSSQDDDGDGEPTPCNSPRSVRKSQAPSLALPMPSLGSGQSTLTRNQVVHATAALQRQNSIARGGNLDAGKGLHHEPRYLFIETRKCSNLGISLVGGNAVGIFVHCVQQGSQAFNADLRTGDQILEYNGTDLRQATAEDAAYELAKPADKVTVLAQYSFERYNQIKDTPGDSFYIRCCFDRNDLNESVQLCFNKDDVLYVDNTMFNGVPGHWRAWKLDSEGCCLQCGIIPSKYKVEEEMLVRRSLGDLEGRGSTSARRSFFRRKKHQRNGSRDSKELASFSNVTLGWYSDSGTLHEDVTLCSYQRVEKLEYTEARPVLILGPLAEWVVDKLVTDFPDQFKKCEPETRQCSQASIDQEMASNAIVDYKRKGNYFECTTVAAIKAVSNRNLHRIIDISVTSVDKLHRHQIYPIVLLIKFKSTKQIKEVKDTRLSPDKITAKAAKEMYEHGLKLEAEYRHKISAVIPAGVNIAYMCTQVKDAVVAEQNKSLWVPISSGN